MKKYLLKRDINRVKYVFMGVMILLMLLALVSGLMINFFDNNGSINTPNLFRVFSVVLVYIIGFVVVVVSSLFIPYIFFILYENDKKEASIIMINHKYYRYMVYQRTALVTLWLAICLVFGYLIFDLIYASAFAINIISEAPLYAYSYAVNVGLGVLILSILIVNAQLTKTRRILVTLVSILVSLIIIVMNFVLIPAGYILAIGESVYLYGNIVFLLSALLFYFIVVEVLLLNIGKRLEI